MHMSRTELLTIRGPESHRPRANGSPLTPSPWGSGVSGIGPKTDRPLHASLLSGDLTPKRPDVPRAIPYR